MEVDDRTAELYSKQGNCDITELVVTDEVTQCEICEEHMARRMCFCECGSILPEQPSGMKETLKEAPKQAMVRTNGLQWRTRGHAGSLSLSQIQKSKIIKPRNITSETYRRNNSQVVLVDG